MRILITGGAGFIGSHVAEYYAKNGDEVICYDNLSRAKLLRQPINFTYNWNYLRNFSSVKLVKADIRATEQLREVAKGADVIIHTAAQTAVTTSVQDPETDFTVNAQGTFNVLEAARLSGSTPIVIFCSTNKVYGDNVNRLQVQEKETRYVFGDKFKRGVAEDFPIDLCEHTPYGCSKLAADLYVQDYARLYGLKTGVFRMSCIYGTRQFGVEDQGWVAWFAIANILDKPITIYGDGKQVRDILYISDLISAFDSFIASDLPQGTFNMGGGPSHTISLLELLDLLQELTGKRSAIHFSQWRPSDQKVYISDISKAKQELAWEPRVSPREGIRNLVNWVTENESHFKGL